MIKEKIIHQIWFQDNTFKFDNLNINSIDKNIIKKIQKSEIPKKYKKNAISWATNNKKWKYILWNESMMEIFLYSNQLLLKPRDLQQFVQICDEHLLLTTDVITLTLLQKQLLIKQLRLWSLLINS